MKNTFDLQNPWRVPGYTFPGEKYIRRDVFDQMLVAKIDNVEDKVMLLRDRLWFYRTTAGSEIDFLFVKGDQTVPVEVKYGISRQKAVPRILILLSDTQDSKRP